MRIALGGRNRHKLEDIKNKLTVNVSSVADMPILVADNNNKQALVEAMSQTKVVISTVGPFILYGTNVGKYFLIYSMYA